MTVAKGDQAPTSATKYYKSIKSVRDTTGQVYEYVVKHNEGNYYILDLNKMKNVADFVCNDIIKKNYPRGNYQDIPPHGRWQHLNYGSTEPRLEKLIKSWKNDAKYDDIEISRKLIDLIVFSVLVDAGAGNLWKFTDPETKEKIGRSEGLAIASYYLFVTGKFSNDKDNYKVNGSKLMSWTMDDFVKGFQVDPEKNPLSGCDGRLKLIQNLGMALISNKEIFGEDGRPGNIVDYLYKNSEPNGAKNNQNVIDLNLLWDTLMTGLTSIWPKGRISIGGESIGDAWFLDTKTLADKKAGVGNDDKDIGVVTFHKLTQWLCYSLIFPLETYGYKFVIENKALQTGLPEYRNGGLFYDFGVLTLKTDVLKRGLELTKSLNPSYSLDIPTYKPEDGAIVEWRCLTIGLLDHLLPMVNERLGFEFSLPQLIEAGSWKGGREIAAIKRPKTKGPPIELFSDGTVF
ncbi:URC4/urg3 family protein [Saccharomycodes ludwigii]|uniref:URC4/urg3 family protein n=1 Tax=Saccharomycodes ludwigii TaxID=36035 RepID=UPI001E83F2D9|nr:conserved putative uracil catabolism 4 protein [Saccharomycodes ludwigii]KAH3899899.1 conserved putative uracil catabolism 4 protein [Saccharomycodes ludwigii]